jgi:acetylglutamate kinase
MKVYGVYNDSKATTVELTEGITTNIDELNADINGTENKTLNVSYSGAYGEFTTALTIYVTDAELTGIEISNFDSEVLLNNPYNKDSVVVYASYGNGTSARVIAFTMTDVATNVAGDVEFTVTYEGKTAVATVKVCTIHLLTLLVRLSSYPPVNWLIFPV